MYHIFVIKTTGEIEHYTQPKAPELDQLQAIVGGYIETIPYFTRLNVDGRRYLRGKAYADEDGIMKQKPFNLKATQAWQNHFTKLVTDLHGDVVFYCKGSPVG